MGKHNRNKKSYYKYAALALLLVFLISAALFAIEAWDKAHGDYTGTKPNESGITYKGQKYAERKELETFLVLGLDQFEETATEDSYNNNKHADFLLLFVFDHEAKKCTAIHINRDTMAQINVLGVAGNKIGTVTKQISLAHTYGNGKDVSCRNTADAVSAVLSGIQIDHYMSVTMDAVPVINDMAGGVELTILDDFTGIDDTLVKDTTVTLTGMQALTYIRARQGLEDSSNSSRMVRQRQYLKALRQKVSGCIDNDGNFLAEAAVQLSEHLISDRSVNQLQQLAERYFSYEDCGILELPGELTQGEEFMEFYPDEDALLELVIGLFFQPK